MPQKSKVRTSGCTLWNTPARPQPGPFKRVRLTPKELEAVAREIKKELESTRVHVGPPRMIKEDLYNR